MGDLPTSDGSLIDSIALPITCPLLLSSLLILVVLVALKAVRHHCERVSHDFTKHELQGYSTQYGDQASKLRRSSKMTNRFNSTLTPTTPQMLGARPTSRMRIELPPWSLEVFTILSFPPCPTSPLLSLRRIASLIDLLARRWRIRDFYHYLR